MKPTGATAASRERSVYRGLPAVRIRRSGITLVEVSISTLLVGLLVIASLQSVANIGRTWTTTNQVVDSQDLAQDLIHELLAQYYTDPVDPLATSWGSGPSETSRKLYNDIDDYTNWSESSSLKSAADKSLPGYAGWSRSVLVEKISTAGYTAISSSAPDSGLRLITVTVTSPAGATTTARVYRSNVGGNLQTISTDVTLVTWVGCALTLGSNAATTGGVCISNHAEDQ